MIDLDVLAELGDLWSGSPPRVKGERCLNVRHRRRNCRICVESCPVDAISIPRGAGVDADPVVLDRDTCVRCGLCVNACPTGVFVQTDPLESKLSQIIARSPSQVVELACPRKEQPELSRVPEASVVPTPRCLAALSVPALLELAALGKSLWLNDSFCHACPIGEARHGIQLSITTATRWLEAMGHEPAIHSYLDAAEQLGDESTSRPLVRGDAYVFSRRDFFRSLRGRSGQAAAGVTADGDALQSKQVAPISSAGPDANDRDIGEGMRHHLAHHIPVQRQQLAGALHRLSPDPTMRVSTAALPIADVIVADSCTACGLCAQFCPTEAIVFLSDGEYYVLHFSAALCLGEDCSLCNIGCPTDAVSFGQEVMADELLSTQPRPVKAGRLAPCPRCGALTDAPLEDDETAEVPFCYVCQAQAARSNLLPNNQPKS